MPSSKAQALAAHLDAAAPSVTSPWHYIALVYAWLVSTAGALIDSPEERAAIEAVVMTQYDKLTLSLMQTNPALAGLFASLRSTVKGALDWILVALAPAPPPTPTPAPVVVPPAGSATGA